MDTVVAWNAALFFLVLSLAHPLRIRFWVKAKFALLGHVPRIDHLSLGRHERRVVATQKRCLRQVPERFIRATFVRGLTRDRHNTGNRSLSIRSTHRTNLANGDERRLQPVQLLRSRRATD